MKQCRQGNVPFEFILLLPLLPQQLKVKEIQIAVHIPLMSAAAQLTIAPTSLEPLVEDASSDAEDDGFNIHGCYKHNIKLECCGQQQMTEICAQLFATRPKRRCPGAQGRCPPTFAWRLGSVQPCTYCILDDSTKNTLIAMISTNTSLHTMQYTHPI